MRLGQSMLQSRYFATGSSNPGYSRRYILPTQLSLSDWYNLGRDKEVAPNLYRPELSFEGKLIRAIMNWA